MKNICLGVILAALTGCGEDQADLKTPKKKPVVDNKTLAINSLDAIYAAQDFFMHSDLDAKSKANNAVLVLQDALAAWPETKEDYVKPCYMTLRYQLTHFLNLQQGMNEPIDSRESDAKFTCRNNIGYSYDQKRTTDYWNAAVKAINERY